MRKTISISLLFILSLIINLSAYADNVLNDTEYDYDNKTPEEIDKINKEKEEEIKNLLALVEKCKLDPNCKLCPDESDKKNPVKHCVNIPSYISPDLTEGDFVSDIFAEKPTNSWFCPSKDNNRAECEQNEDITKELPLSIKIDLGKVHINKTPGDNSANDYNNIGGSKRYYEFTFIQNNNRYIIAHSYNKIDYTDSINNAVRKFTINDWVIDDVQLGYKYGDAKEWSFVTNNVVKTLPTSRCIKGHKLGGGGFKCTKEVGLKVQFIVTLYTDKGLLCPLDSNAKCYKDTDSKYYCSTNPCANGNDISTSKPGDTDVSSDDLIKFPNKKKNNCSADDVTIGDGAMMSCRKGWFGAPLSNNCCIMTPDLKEAQNKLISGFSNVLSGLTGTYAGGAELLKLLGLAEDNFVKEYFTNFFSWFAGGECSDQETTVAQMAGSTRNISYTDLAFKKEENGKPYGDSTFGENPDLYAKQYGKDYINNGHGKKEHYPGAYGNCVYITTYCAEYYPGGCFKFNIFGQEHKFPIIKGCRRPAYAMCCYNSLFDKALALEARHQGFATWGDPQKYPAKLGHNPCDPDKDKLKNIECQGPSIEDLSNMNLDSLTFQDNINVFADVLLKEDGDMMHSIDEAVKNTGVAPTDKEISDLLQQNNMEFNDLIKKDPAEVDKFMRKLIEKELKDEK